MYCSHCGTTNTGDAKFCSGCGATLSAESAAAPQAGTGSEYAPPGYQRYEYVDPRGPAPNRLLPAILVTLFCCMPFGIVSIVYAALSMSKNSAGDFDGAHTDASKAVMWAWIGFGVGIVPTLIYAFAVVAGIMSEL